MTRATPARIDEDACIAAASPAARCSRCLDRCPTGAIVATDGRLDVDAGSCLSCGRCAAACPSEAIAVEGFAAPRTPAPAFECNRNGPDGRVPGAAVVACLGGLKVASLLEAVRYLKRDVEILDRGWCETCPAGGGGAPWREAVAEANALLADLVRWRVVVRSSPLPETSARAVPDLLATSGAARRRLFQRFFDPLPPTPSRASAMNVHKVDAKAFRRRQAVVLALAADNGQSIPARHYPAATIAEDCCDRRVCVAVCPTGALSQADDRDLSVAVFDPTLCTACRACEAACPSGAISIAACGTGDFQGPVRLRGSSRTVCRHCNGEFIPRADEAVCPPCRSSAELAREGFLLLRRSASASGEILKT